MSAVPGYDTSFAVRFNYLLDHFRKTVDQVAAGTGISRSYLFYLKNGERPNVTMDYLEKIASFFGVSPLFFSRTPENWAPPVPGATIQFALRTAGNLDDDAKKMLESLMERARHIASGVKPPDNA